MSHGIYVAEVSDGNNVDQRTRIVLVAVNAAEAQTKAAAIVWPQADMALRAAMIEDGRVDIGRLGDFNPGITGEALSRGSCIAVQRMGQQ